MDFDPHYSCHADERMAAVKYLDHELKSMAAQGYSDVSLNVRSRQIALYRILQNYRTENFDAFIPYLAMNYFDRFLSRHEPLGIEENRVTDVDLLAIACLSLAWKMRSSSFNLSEFLKEKQIRLKKKNIMIAELRVLIGLDWRMRSITAFSFARYYFDACRPPKGLRMQTMSQIIVETQDDIRFTAFKPSVISASALLAAFWYLYRQRYQVYEDRLKNIRYLDKTELNECVALMKEMCAQKQLWMETAEMDIMEGMRMRVQARAQRRRPAVESSESSQQQQKPSSGSKPIMLPIIEEGRSSEVAEDAKEVSHLTGKEAVEEAQEEGAPKPGKGPIEVAEEEGKEQVEEAEEEGSHRPGKELVEATEEEGAHRPGKEPVEEEGPEPKLEPVSQIQPAEEVPIMNFELKWVADCELDSVLSRPPGLAGVDCLSFLPCCNNNFNDSCIVL